MQKKRSNIHVSQSDHMEVEEGREQSLQSFHCQRNFAQSITTNLSQALLRTEEF